MFKGKKRYMTENCVHSFLFHYVCCICKNALQSAGGSTRPQSAAGPPGMTYLDSRPVLPSSQSAGLCH